MVTFSSLSRQSLLRPDDLNMPNNIFTIGHSTHPIDTFLELLHQHGVTAVCDVRSSPYSKFNPQFNREDLKLRLSECGIKYVFKK